MSNIGFGNPGYALGKGKKSKKQKALVTGKGLKAQFGSFFSKPKKKSKSKR